MAALPFSSLVIHLGEFNKSSRKDVYYKSQYALLLVEKLASKSARDCKALTVLRGTWTIWSLFIYSLRKPLSLPEPGSIRLQLIGSWASCKIPVIAGLSIESFQWVLNDLALQAVHMGSKVWSLQMWITVSSNVPYRANLKPCCQEKWLNAEKSVYIHHGCVNGQRSTWSFAGEAIRCDQSAESCSNNFQRVDIVESLGSENLAVAVSWVRVKVQHIFRTPVSEACAHLIRHHRSKALENHM